MPVGSERSQKLLEILRSHDIKVPADANRLYALLSGHERIDYASRIAGNLAKTDVQAALTWAAGLPSGQGRASSLAATTKVWVESDPRAALEWSLKNNTTAENSNILGAAFSAWMSESPDQALALLNTLPRDKNRETLMGQAITSLLETPGAQGALDLFNNELSVEGQRIASYAIASKLLLSDPAAATAWAEQITDDRARQNAIGRIAAEWSARAPDAAAAWAENLPEGSGRGEALANISFQWTKSDPEAAAKWLTNFQKGDERDHMVSNFSLNLVEYDPESAVNWAGSITDPAVKQLRIQELTTVWLRKDPASARAWIAKNSPSGRN